MRAIILAAGCGNRMGELTKDYPKAMLPLHGKALIEWQMNALQGAGATDISIVKGYKGDIFSYPVTYFNNERWKETNMLSTLLCADEWLSQDTCVVSYADIVYQAEAVKKLQNCSGDIAITYDPNWLTLWQQRFDDPLSDAEIFKFKDNLLLNIGGKATGLHEITGQYMGLLKFTVDGWKKAKSFLEQFSTAEIDKMDMTALLNLMLLNQHEISVVPINAPWCEIDNSTDYKICQKIFSEALVFSD